MEGEDFCLAQPLEFGVFVGHGYGFKTKDSEGDSWGSEDRED